MNNKNSILLSATSSIPKNRKIHAYNNLDYSDFNLKSYYEEVNLRTSCHQDVTVDMNSGFMLDRNNKPVKPTWYMNPKAMAGDYPVTEHKPAGCISAYGEHVILHNIGWTNNHYHTLLQLLTSAYLLARYAPDLTASILLPPLKQKYRLLIDKIGLKQTIYLPRHNKIWIENCITVNSTYGMNSVYASHFLREFGSFLNQSIPENIKGPGKKIYITRKGTKKRILLNEQAIEDSFIRAGFTIVRLEDMQIFEQMAAFRDAKIVIAPHGAGLANIIFSEPGTKIVELIASCYPNPCFADVANSAQLDYEMHIFPATGQEHKQRFEWEIPIDYINRLAERLSQ